MHQTKQCAIYILDETSLTFAQEAHALLERLLAHAQALAEAEARVDYFATSLPTMLLFHDDLQDRQVGLT